MDKGDLPMNRTWWLGALILMTAASAIVLPGFADLEDALDQNRSAVEVFGEDGSIVLSGSNLVDAVGSIPFTLPISSVGWDNGVLSLDLKVTGSDHEPGELYRNMARAISFTVQETVNVNQLLLRIVAEDKWTGTRSLLLAGDIRRREWSEELQQELQDNGDNPLSARIKAGFRISESELWQNQFFTL